MRKRILSLFLVTLFTIAILTGCTKNVSKMSDEELYTYLISMEEEERMEFIEKLDDEQQYRANIVLILAELGKAETEDDFANSVIITD